MKGLGNSIKRLFRRQKSAPPATKVKVTPSRNRLQSPHDPGEANLNRRRKKNRARNKAARASRKRNRA